MVLAAQLDEAIQKVCPISGISIGRRNDRSTWKFRPSPEATPEQKIAAQHVIDTFVFVETPRVDPEARLVAIENRLAALERRP